MTDIARQIRLLNSISEESHTEPLEALMRLHRELPLERLDRSLMFIWSAVFYQATEFHRRQIEERPSRFAVLAARLRAAWA